MWKSESDFSKSFEKFLHNRIEELLLRGKGAVLLREYEPGFGRVDMVLVAYDIDRLQQRMRQSSCSYQQELGKDGACAMSYLTHTRWVSQERLSGVLSVSRSRVNLLITNLKSRGLIETRDELVKARTMRESWVIDGIESFELKLENWRRALDQAYRHLWFASRSYIVMPDRSEKISRQIARGCVVSSVGAILCQTHGIWKTFLSPPRTPVPSSHVGWLLNESIVSEESNAQLRFISRSS